MANSSNQQNRAAWWRRRVLSVVVVVLIVLLYAYAVQVTQVNLEEPLEPQRQKNLVSLIRELAHPDLLSFENETRSTNMSIRMPCPEEVRGSQVSVEGRRVLMVPNCTSTTQDLITLTGEGFAENVDVVVGWYPLGAETIRRVAEFKADGDGNFNASFTMPDIRESEEPQRIEIVEVIDRRITGLSDTTKLTLNRIVETILMALMASTIGTILAVPISFLGARNLMSDVTAPLASIMAAFIALPIGGFAGLWVGRLLNALALTLSEPSILAVGALAVVVVAIWLLLRAIPGEADEGHGPTYGRILAALLILVAVLLFFLGLGLLAQIGLVVGAWLDANLGIFSFIGNFIFVLSDLLRVLLPALMAFIGALVAASYGSRYAQEAVLNLATGPGRLLTSLLTAMGTFIFIFGLAYAANWICLLGLCRQLPQETGALVRVLVVPSFIGAVLAAVVSLRTTPKRPYPVGLVTYTITRTILNVLRAIEPVIMGFVLVVWVGIGPFAGIMALMLHSIADLGKLFSEQVENIDEGPLEAVTATGASRVQTTVFAVIPQIVPHYTAFIFYRWDINVRMSTIIGFVGGGGIGLVLFRSTNLTQYRQASVMVIAIAIVVIVLDYVSSKLRSQII